MIALTDWQSGEVYVDPAKIDSIVPIGDSGVTIVSTFEWDHYVRETPQEIRRRVEACRG